MDASQLPGGVTLYYTDKAVHLTTNDALMTFLRQKGNGSLPLSRAILAGYEAECGAALQITERSMATEILIHAYLDVLFLRAKCSGGRRLAAWGERMETHTTVIDIGERAVDTNRHIIDRLSHFYGVLRVVLGKWA